MVDFKGFSFTVGDDDKHERLTAQIDFNGQYFGLISQENGVGKEIIHLFAPDDFETPIYELQLDDLIVLLEMARRRLSDLSGG